jgi:hypothetical protein
VKVSKKSSRDSYKFRIVLMDAREPPFVNERNMNISWFKHNDYSLSQVHRNFGLLLLPLLQLRAAAPTGVPSATQLSV